MTQELRDPDSVRAYLLTSLWLQRVLEPRSENVATILGWAHAWTSEGDPLPPLGLVADIAHLALGLDAGEDTSRRGEWSTRLGIDPGLIRSYDDSVLGKLYADWSFQRAADALGRYQGDDRTKALVYLLRRIQDRAKLPGVVINPAEIKSLAQQPAAQLLAEGWETIENHGVHTLVADMYPEVTVRLRNTTDLVGAEDLFELEHRTALSGFGQRLALRQVLQAAERLTQALPDHRPRPATRRYELPTQVFDEDAYPVGGYTSISTRGSIESLLHSQLAYMETDERPDLFDIKFLRDELYYYSRDENQFLRRRLVYVIAMGVDLTEARVKEIGLPFQRLIMTLAMLVTSVRRLMNWLGDEHLRFEFLVGDAVDRSSTRRGKPPLEGEEELLRMIFREHFASGMIGLTRLPQLQWAERVAELSRQASCHVLAIGTEDNRFVSPGAMVTGFRLADSLEIAWPGLPYETVAGETPWEQWITALEELLDAWI